MHTTTIDTPPAGSTRSTAGLAILGAATFIGVATEVLPVGLLPQISRDLSISEAVAGLTVTGYALVVALCATPLTVLTARWPRRRLLLTVLSLYGASNALAAFAPNFTVLIAARVLGGLCHGVFWSMNTGYAARLVPDERVGRATGAVFTGSALAVAVGLPVSTAIGQSFGWRVATIGAAGITALIAVLARLLLPALPALVTGGILPGQERPTRHRRTTGAVRDALSRPGVRAVAGITGLIVLGLYVFFSYISVYLGRLGLSGPTVSAALLAYGAGGVLGTVLLGRAYDRWPRQSFFTVIGILLAALLGLAALTLLSPGRLDIPALGLAAVLGAAALSMAVPLQAMIFAHAGPAPDAASSLFVAAFNFGIGGGAVIGAILLSAFGSGILPIAALVIATLGAGYAVRRAPWRPPRPRSNA